MHTLWANIFRKIRRPEEEDVFAILRGVPIFQGLSQGDLREFERILHRRKYQPGETIFYEGEPGVGMYIIQRGKVAIAKGEGVDQEELALLKDGDFFGELALLDESPRSASAQARDETHIIGLFRPDLFELLDRKPQLGVKILLNLAQMIGERLKRTNEALQALRGQEVPERSGP